MLLMLPPGASHRHQEWSKETCPCLQDTYFSLGPFLTTCQEAFCTLYDLSVEWLI